MLDGVDHDFQFVVDIVALDTTVDECQILVCLFELALGHEEPGTLGKQDKDDGHHAEQTELDEQRGLEVVGIGLFKQR